MTEVQLTIIVNAAVAMIQAIPSIIASIQGMDMPEEKKEALIARVEAAKANLPDWK